MNQSLKILIAACVVFLYFIQEADSQNVLFANGVGGQQFDQAMGIANGPFLSSIATGYFAGTSDFNSSNNDSLVTSVGSNDIFMVKNDSAGNFVWAFAIGGVLDEFTYANPVVDAAGNIYVCGVYSDTVDFDPSPANFYKLTSRGQFDGFIAKYDNDGNFLWVRSFGGLLNDDIYSIALADNGDILFAGSFDTSADLDPDTAVVTSYNSNGGTDIFFGRMDVSGNISWLRTLGGVDFDHANTISGDVSGNIILQGAFTISMDADPGAGSTVVSGINSPGFMAKYNSSGTFMWANAFNSFSPFGLAIDSTGNIYSCGYINGNTDFNPGPDTNQVFLIGSFDGYLAKFDSNGNYIHAFGIGSNSFDVAYGVQLVDQEKVVIAGYFNNSADFNPSASVNALTSYGMADVFVAGYDTALSYLHAFKAGSAMFDFCRNISAGPDHSLLLAGGFSVTADFDPGPALQTLTSNGSRDGYIVKYGDVVTGVNILPGNDLMVNVFPNPSGNLVTVETKLIHKHLTIELINLNGIKLLSEDISNTSIYTIDMSQLSQGVYFLRMKDDHSVAVKKIIRQ